MIHNTCWRSYSCHDPATARAMQAADERHDDRPPACDMLKAVRTAQSSPRTQPAEIQSRLSCCSRLNCPCQVLQLLPVAQPYQQQREPAMRSEKQGQHQQDRRHIGSKARERVGQDGDALCHRCTEDLQCLKPPTVRQMGVRQHSSCDRDMCQSQQRTVSAPWTDKEGQRWGGPSEDLREASPLPQHPWAGAVGSSAGVSKLHRRLPLVADHRAAVMQELLRPTP